jgi:AraC-like DNA-binding protein
MYQLRSPAEALQTYIEHYWFVSQAPGEIVGLRVDVFVDARADLVFNFDAPYRREVIGGPTVELGASNLDAQRLTPIRIIQRGSVRIAGVRFRLGGLAPFAREALAPFTDRTPAPEEVLGAEALTLESDLDDGPTPDEAAALLDAFFLDRFIAPPAGFARALDALVATGGRASVAELSDAAAASHRQTERLFARHLGIPPKTVGRIVRFQGALRALMADPGCPLGEIAVDAGYYDQAHFIRDFRLFSGGVPRGYRGYYPPDGPADFAPNVVAFIQDAAAVAPRN